MDRRDLAANTARWWKEINERDKTVVVTLTLEDDDGEESEQDISFPFKYVVCDLCEGRGQHVNPSIDSHGITEDEMRELGPDFEQDYFGGLYDISCNQCSGKRVVPEIDEERCNAEQKAYLRDLEDSRREDAEFAALCAAERAMGA